LDEAVPTKAPHDPAFRTHVAANNAHYNDQKPPHYRAPFPSWPAR
jgi:hypothetical protein